MRTLLCLFLTIFSTYALAEHIRCFSAGKQIYSGYSDSITYEDGVYFLMKNNSDNVIFINGDCVGNITAKEEGN